MVDKLIFGDLSLTGTAFAVLVFDCGEVSINDTLFIDNKKNIAKGLGYRLNKIAEGLEGLLEKHQDIKGMVREKGFSKFPAITQTLFRVVGVSDLTIYRKGFDVIMDELPPTTLKKFVAGDGKASKDEVAACVRNYLPAHQKDYEFITDDVSDAVAVGIAWGIKNKKIKNLF